MVPIDITSEAKTIVKKETVKSSNIFTLETKGMKLTFQLIILKKLLMYACASLKVDRFSISMCR